MKPLVSILIPVYNAQDWIAGTIRSAQEQTWSNKEIIIVEDGSSDDTRSVIKQFAGPEIQVICQENQGASGARNTAYQHAQGEYIQWFDADDLLAPDKIERQMECVERDQDPKILYSGQWGYFFFRTSRTQFHPTPLWEDLSPAEFLRRKMSQNLHMQPDCWLVSRELTDAAGPWDTSLWRDNDGEYFCRVILASNKICHVPDARSYYRRSGAGSVSYIGKSQKKIESLFRSMNLHVEYLLSLENSERTRAGCVSYLKIWLHNFYPERMDLVERLRVLAEKLGGELPNPELSWKYRPIAKMFGWEMAKRVRRLGPTWKESLKRNWDYTMARFSGELEQAGRQG